MNRKIDTKLFTYIIGDDDDAGAGGMKLELIDEGGLITQYYLGINGNKVGVLISDEFIPERTAKDLLRLLGMSDLIERMFPPIIVEDAQPIAIEPIVNNNGNNEREGE